MGEDRRQATQELPHDLEELPVGPDLAAVLASVDRRLLDDRDRVRLVQARNRMVAHLQAELYADIYAVSWGEPPAEGLISSDEEPYAWTTTEVAMALTWTKFATGVRLEQARRMIEDLPAVRHSLRDGLIDMPKALVICDGVASLELDTARRVVEQVLAKAPELTTGQLRVWLRRLVMAADPAAAAEAAKQASRGRWVDARLNDNQLADLAGHDLAPHRVAAGWERINAIARAAKAAGDPRSMDELRSDAMMDLLIGEGIAVGEPITDGGFAQRPGEATTGSGGGGRGGPVVSPTIQGMNVTTDDTPTPTSPPTPAPQQRPDAGSSGQAPAGVKRASDADLRRELIRTRRWDHNLRPGEDRAGMAWPAAPADPSLLDPEADPPQASTDPPPSSELPLPAEPPDGEHQSGPGGDAEHELLRPFWLAGFHHLPHTRPSGPGPSRGGGVLPSPRRGALELHMAVYSLMGYDDLPAELAGFGPVLADIARQVIRQRPDLAHKYNIYDPDGQLLTRITTNQRPTTIPDGPAGARRTKRRPTTEVAEFVRARNRTCIRPGCRRHARSCELDHNLAWSEGGESEANNLGPECIPDHDFKHAPGARLIQSGTGGRFGWITPKGMRYIKTADPPLYDDLDIIDPCQ